MSRWGAKSWTTVGELAARIGQSLSQGQPNE
jgi:hypothetical protein